MKNERREDNNEWIASRGRLIYRPQQSFSLRKKRQVDTHHTIVTADAGLSEYYRWWIEKRFHLWIQPPMLNLHVSIFNGKEVIPESAAEVLSGLHDSFVEYEYSVNVQQHWKFWVLPVRSKQLEQIRNLCGVAPNYHFHITIGRMV